MIVTGAFTLVFGQTPEAPKPPAPQTFAFTFEGSGSYLGVQTKEVNQDNYSQLGLREVRGVAVDKVMENSPAAAAGILQGDVIVRFNGEEVTSSRKLTRLVGEIDPDHQARITVLRGGKEREMTATLAKRQGPSSENGAFDMGKFEMPDLKDLPELKELPEGSAPRVFNMPGGEGKVFTFHTGGRQIGVGAANLTKQLAAHFGVENGVLVSEVREGSPAEKAGIKAGDIIVEANGTPIKGNGDLVKAINEKKDGDVNLTIVRNGSRQNISVTPEAAKDGNFYFKGDGEDGLVMPAMPAMPGQFKVGTPAIPAFPASAPMIARPALPRRVI